MLPYYYSVSEYLKDTYGKKLYKLSLSGNMTCPNRDGKLGTTVMVPVILPLKILTKLRL